MRLSGGRPVYSSRGGVMRGDQLARQRRIIRSIEASPNGLTVAQVAQREGIGQRTTYRDLIAPQEVFEGTPSEANLVELSGSLRSQFSTPSPRGGGDA